MMNKDVFLRLARPNQLYKVYHHPLGRNNVPAINLIRVCSDRCRGELTFWNVTGREDEYASEGWRFHEGLDDLCTFQLADKIYPQRKSLTK